MTDDLIERVGIALYGKRWQAEMARAIGVNKDTVQDWRQQRAKPRSGVYKDLLDIASERQGELATLVEELARVVA